MFTSSIVGTYTYLGVVILVRVIDGKLSKHMKIKMMSTNQVIYCRKKLVFLHQSQLISLN